MAPSLLALAAVGALLLLPSCAVLPAELKPAKSHDADLKLSLGELLEKALDPSDPAEADHALAHFVTKWFTDRDAAGSGEVTNGPTRFEVDFANDRDRCYPPSYFDELAPAEDYTVTRLDHHRRAGAGAPLIALRENTHREPIERYYPDEAITRPLTAFAVEEKPRHGVRRVTIRLLCPLFHETVVDKGKRRTLAADFSAPWAALLTRTKDLKKSELGDLLGTPKRTPQLYLMEPYDPGKEPLIMIHGLLSSPLAWAELSNELWAFDDIRRRYQIWHFLYNTSAPALYSGRLLREQLRELRPMLDPGLDDPAMRSTTLLTHSMGGIVGRSLIVKPREVFWDAAFTRPPEALKLTPEDRADLTEAFFWQPERHVKRVIWVAVPHRGSNYADNFVGRIGRLLAGPPKTFQQFYKRVSSANPGAFTSAYQELGRGRLDSVNALSPKQPTLQILSQLRPHYQVATHSIIGNRGKPGPLEESSDGIVPYWSSHVPWVQSEKIVPAGHDAYRDPQARAEIVRILRLKR